jgi:hypothetical protein
MKRKIGISLILTFVLIFPSLTVAVGLNQPLKKCNLFGNDLGCDLCPVHPISVTKKIFKSDSIEWVDYYDAEISEKVIFNLTITYHKTCLFGCSAINISVIDNLPSGLSYVGSSFYNESFINGSKIHWNLSDDYSIILLDDESISIEFEAVVNEYGEHVNYVEVFAIETGCDWDLYGDADATVYGVPPDPSFVKKVKDTETGEWVNETFQYVTEKVKFKIELTYYGVYNLTNVTIVDYLPEITNFGNQASMEPSYVSEDGSIVMWNLTDPLENDEPLIITYDAYVWGRTGDCQDCGINLAEYTALENITQKVHQGEDSAIIVTDEYKDPELVYFPTNINFGEQDQGWTGSETFEIWNGGEQLLSYTLTENLGWIEVTPTSGSSEGEHDTITVSVLDTSNMSGYYGGNIDIFSNGGSGCVFVSIFIDEEIPTEPALKVLIKRGLRRSVNVEIENTGNEVLNNITWSITVSRRGFIKKTLMDINGSIPTLEVDMMETISERLFAFGFIIVDIEVNAEGLEPIEIKAKGFIIFRFIRLRRFL